MTDYASFITQFTLYALAMQVSPGPNNTAFMAVGISCGYRATLPHAAAVIFFSMLMLFLVGCGLGEIFMRWSFLYRGLQVVGAIYLVWLAARIAGFDAKDIIKRHILGIKETEKSHAGVASTHVMKPMTFLQATGFQLINVKAWLASIIAYSVYGGASGVVSVRFFIMLVIYGLIAALSTIIWGGCGAFLGQFLSSEGMKRCNYVFAGFLLLSVFLIFM